MRGRGSRRTERLWEKIMGVTRTQKEEKLSGEISQRNPAPRRTRMVLYNLRRPENHKGNYTKIERERDFIRG